MRSLLKKWWRWGGRRYSLTVSELKVRDNTLFCRIEDAASVNPYEVSLPELFRKDEVLAQIKPRELLKLKEQYDRFVREYVMVIETHRNNKYKLAYAEQEFLMGGSDICKDLNLLKSMKTEDAFRISYATGFDDALKLNQQHDVLEKQVISIEKKTPDNVLPLRWE